MELPHKKKEPVSGARVRKWQEEEKERGFDGRAWKRRVLEMEDRMGRKVSGSDVRRRKRHHIPVREANMQLAEDLSIFVAFW